MIPEEGTARVVVEYSNNGGSYAVNVLHFLYDLLPGGQEDELEALVGGWWSNQETNWTSLFGTASSVVSLTIYVWNGTTKLFDPVRTIVVNAPGTQIGDQMPPGVSTLLQWLTDNQRVRGKTYVPYPTESVIEADGTFSTAHVGGLALVAVSTYGRHIGAEGEMQLAVWSPKLEAAELVTGAIVTQYPAYQRRRKVGVGQ